MWRRQLRALSAPVVVTIVVPALIFTFAPVTVGAAAPLRVLTLAAGVVLMLGGVTLLVWTITLFGRVGGGTLHPSDPPRALVVTGPYRHVRNPMFTGVLAVLLGEILATGSLLLLAWWGLFFGFVGLLVPRTEEPRLARRFGADYARYRDHVPRWLPRLRPWRQEQATPSR